MKKYLFLLFLIGVYVLILFNNKDNKTSNVVSYLDKNRDGTISVKINFKDGINSNNLKKLFYTYDKDYYIYNIYIDRENIKVNCDSIDWCIDSVYEQKDDYFNKSRLTSGFKVDSISLLAYKEDIIPFINDNNLECEIK